MRIRGFLTALLASSFSLCFSQNPSLEWARAWGGTDQDDGNAITTDAAGNVYSIGYFQGTVDFDPGPGTHNLYAVDYPDAFISKMDANGNFVWAKKLGGNVADFGLDIRVDGLGYVYITGYFDEVATIGTFTMTGAGGYEPFVCKLDANGNCRWAKCWGGYSDDHAGSIVVDDTGSVYCAGAFRDSADFDPSPGTYMLHAAGDMDMFVTMLDSGGNFVWAKGMGGLSIDIANDIAVDGDGNIFLAGVFRGTTDFDPGPNVAPLTSVGPDDVCIVKLDPSGGYLWAKHIGSNSLDAGMSIGVDGAGSAYVAGYFSGAADFDPGPAIHQLTAMGTWDGFVCKLDGEGDFRWAKRLGNAGLELGRAVALDATGNVYTTGYFEGTVDFNPGGGAFYLSAMGNKDIFLQKLDSAGNFIWARALGGPGEDEAEHIHVDAADHVYTTGSFEHTADFDPGTSAVTLTANGSYDAFIHKMRQSGVGLPEGQDPIHFSVYPNPSAGKLTVDLGKPYKQATLTVYDAAGRSCLTRTHHHTQSIQLEFDAPAGMYFLHLRTEHAQTAIPFIHE